MTTDITTTYTQFPTYRPIPVSIHVRTHPHLMSHPPIVAMTSRQNGALATFCSLYSLLVCVFSSDFIRTFTWDKKLEMYVKSTGILGGQGKMPTVVSPQLYRERFCEAMQRYFLMIPNKWMGLSSEKT